MMVSWSFVLHKERSGRYSVRARVRLQGKPTDTGTGVTIASPADWDTRRQRVRATSNAAAVANITLTAVDGALSDLIARAAIDRRNPTREETADLSGHPDLAAVRDVFVFCCYSWLRFSDAKALKEADIHGGCIHVVTKKTTDPLAIELNCHTRAILYRWHGKLGGRTLPCISNQNTNYRPRNWRGWSGSTRPSARCTSSARSGLTRPARRGRC